MEKAEIKQIIRWLRILRIKEIFLGISGVCFGLKIFHKANLSWLLVIIPLMLWVVGEGLTVIMCRRWFPDE
jgi:hypothetical protein